MIQTTIVAYFTATGFTYPPRNSLARFVKKLSIASHDGLNYSPFIINFASVDHTNWRVCNAACCATAAQNGKSDCRVANKSWCNVFCGGCLCQFTTESGISLSLMERGVLSQRTACEARRKRGGCLPSESHCSVTGRDDKALALSIPATDFWCGLVGGLCLRNSEGHLVELQTGTHN